jgi:hypothetical protein
VLLRRHRVYNTPNCCGCCLLLRQLFVSLLCVSVHVRCRCLRRYVCVSVHAPWCCIAVRTPFQAVASKFRNAGQTCVCTNRLFVHERLAADFTAKLAAAVAALRVGHGLLDGVQVGPLINDSGACVCVCVCVSVFLPCVGRKEGEEGRKVLS